MFNYSSKLAELGYRPLKDEGGMAGYDAVPPAGDIGLKVPEDYLEFLSAFPLTGVFDKRVIFSGIQASPWAANGKEVLEVLYGHCSDKNNDLTKVREQYMAQLPAYFLVVGQVTGANLICLDMRSASFGHVYIWDHEHLGDDQMGFYLAAKSFDAFFKSLRLEDDDLPGGGPKLVKMDLSASLKARVEGLLKNKDRKS